MTEELEGGEQHTVRQEIGRVEFKTIYERLMESQEENEQLRREGGE